MSKRVQTKQDEREKINVRERLTDNVLDLSLMNISVVPVDEIVSALYLLYAKCPTLQFFFLIETFKACHSSRFIKQRHHKYKCKNNILQTINQLNSKHKYEFQTEFTTLVQLTKLDLSNNKIRLITDDFGNLVNLRHLNLYNNQIERLPLSFGHLKKLKYLDLKNNRLNPVFSKIVGTCTDQKDCMEAARKAVAFMVDIEQQVIYNVIDVFINWNTINFSCGLLRYRSWKSAVRKRNKRN